MIGKIVAEEGVLKGISLPLEGEEDMWILGRDPEESQIILEDPSVSRKHLRLKNSPEGVMAENLSETNPILINDLEVTSPQLLQNGDSLKIGDGYYRYYQEEEAVSPDSEAPEPEPSADFETEEEEERETIFEEEEPEEGLAEIDIDLSETSPLLMKVVSGPNNGAQFSMFPDTSYVMGSDPGSCDIVFHDASVSRRHARLTVSKDSTLTIEDLGSSNGTFIESKKIEGQQTFSPNTLISVGTTSFIIYDREGERSTIVSPLLPEIVKILQQQGEEEPEEGKEAQETEPAASATSQAQEIYRPAKPRKSLGSLFFISMITGVFLIVGIASIFLFQTQEIKEPKINAKQILDKVINPQQFPSVHFIYNDATGRLFLVGHVLNSVDRNQLIYAVKSLPFVKELDNNVVSDESIWQEQNQILAKNPAWRGVTIHSPSPGKFVISGYIKTSKEATALSNYLAQNFPYLDLLQRRIIVEETVLNTSKAYLKDAGYNKVNATFSDGAIVLSGDIPSGEKANFNKVIAEIKGIEGVRDVKSYISELPPIQTMVDLTKNYHVSGSLTQPNGQISVIIQGQVLSKGDVLDGKTITSIKPGVIMLEKGGVKYKIDFNQ